LQKNTDMMNSKKMIL